jgi:hypothetical protein
MTVSHYFADMTSLTRALASYYLSPVSAQVGSRLGTYVHQKLPSKEGTGISWLRNKLQSVGLSRKNT